MARWKAIYLVKGCDQVWSALQRLQFLAKPSAPIVPSVLRLDQDGTIADGNWSARELLSLLNTGEFLGPGKFQVSLDPSWTTWGDSLYALLVVLNIVANGNWAGPTTQESLKPPMKSPSAFAVCYRELQGESGRPAPRVFGMCDLFDVRSVRLFSRLSTRSRAMEPIQALGYNEKPHSAEAEWGACTGQ